MHETSKGTIELEIPPWLDGLKHLRQVIGNTKREWRNNWKPLEDVTYETTESSTVLSLLTGSDSGMFLTSDPGTMPGTTATGGQEIYVTSQQPGSVRTVEVEVSRVAGSWLS